jgi:excisionase family DNA binding protein
MSGRTNKAYCAPLQAEGLRVEEAVAVSGIGRSKLYEFIKAGMLTARKSGKTTIILRSDIMKLLEDLRAQPARARSREEKTTVCRFSPPQKGPVHACSAAGQNFSPSPG